MRGLQQLAEVRQVVVVRQAAWRGFYRHRPLCAGLPGRDGQPELHRGVDANKDQSYVLHGIRRAILPHLLFPVGGYTKDHIRTIAREAGLGVAEKPDSVEICFVPDGDHAGLIRRRRPDLDTAGMVEDKEGNMLGKHDGYERFTIGQRKGLGIATDRKRYVLEIVPESRTVVLGDAEELLSDQLEASGVNWLIDPPIEAMRCHAKIRYRHTGAAARVTAKDGKGRGGEVRGTTERDYGGAGSCLL